MFILIKQTGPPLRCITSLTLVYHSASKFIVLTHGTTSDDLERETALCATPSKIKIHKRIALKPNLHPAALHSVSEG